MVPIGHVCIECVGMCAWVCMLVCLQDNERDVLLLLDAQTVHVITPAPIICLVLSRHSLPIISVQTKLILLFILPPVSIVPESVYLLEKLRRVTMHHNSIKELSSLIDTWEQLRTLDVSFNHITALHVRHAAAG